MAKGSEGTEVWVVALLQMSDKICRWRQWLQIIADTAGRRLKCCSWRKLQVVAAVMEIAASAVCLNWQAKGTGSF